MQKVLQFLHQSYLFLLRIELFCLFQTVEFILFSVHQREVQKGLFIASLGYRNCHSFKIDIDLFWQDNFLCIALKTLTHFDDSQLQQFLVSFLEFLLIFKGKTLVNLTI